MDYQESLSKQLARLLAIRMNQSVTYDTKCSTFNNETAANNTNCSMKDDNLLRTIFDETIQDNPNSAQLFFTYFTPIVFSIGVLGNVMSLIVFMSRNMRNLSASIYLSALSTSDLMALIFYVLPEWLKYGLSSLPGNHSAIFLQYNGTCQVILYLQYISRFLSSWFLVFFTIERFIAVCFPLRRKDICDPRTAVRVLICAIIVASLGCLFKPVLSGSYTALNGDPLCTSNEKFQYTSFILDSIFGVTITLVPFVLITILNLLIIRKLVLRNRLQRKIRIITEESIIRLEFTFILLAISICFVSLNLPYFAVWCQRYWIYKQTFSLTSASPAEIHHQYTHIGDLDAILNVTRTIFYINYCINFFLYSVTGAYFRKELKQLFLLRKRSGYNQNNSNICIRNHMYGKREPWV